MMLEPQSLQSLQNDFEMAQLLFSNGSFTKSLPYFEKCLKQFKESEDQDSYINCYFYTSIILFELQDWEKLKWYKAELDKVSQQKVFLKQALIPTLQAYYNIYLEPDLESSKKQLNQALKRAIAKNEHSFETGDIIEQQQSRYEVMLCLYIYSFYYYESKDYKACLKELENLDILIKDFIKLKTKMEQETPRDGDLHARLLSNLQKNFSSVQNMKCGVQLVKNLIQIYFFKNYKQAKNQLWNLYEEAHRNYNQYQASYILFYITLCCIYLNNRREAQTFLDLLKKSTEPQRKTFFNFLEKTQNQLDRGLVKEAKETKYDIVFDRQNKLVIQKGKVVFDLKNKFVLMDLLELFLSHPGVPFSKAQLIKKVWAQEYSPQAHDNKLYVTIKRLREIVEVDSCRPAYICRNHAGYYLSRTTKILIKEKEI